MTVLERSEERVERCRAALARRDPPAGLDNVFQQEVGHRHRQAQTSCRTHNVEMGSQHTGP